MDVLLTNDDGVDSPGLTAARDALIGAGMSVLTVAPDGPRSGTARSASFRKAIHQLRCGGDDANPIYKTNGTPVDCVRVAILSGLASNAKVVVSGINEGANLGDDATYSSTLGAAIEGALLGKPALAASQQSRDGRFRLVDRDGYDFDVGAEVTAEFVRRMIQEPPPPRTVLNINAPAKISTTAIELTHLDHRKWSAETTGVVETPEGTGWFTFGTNLETDPDFVGMPGSDVAALKAGRMSVTPFWLSWDDAASRRSTLRWTRKAISAVSAREGAV